MGSNVSNELELSVYKIFFMILVLWTQSVQVCSNTYQNKKHSKSANLYHVQFEERETAYSGMKQFSQLLLVSMSWKYQ